MVASAAQRGEARSRPLERRFHVLEYFAGVGEVATSGADATISVIGSADRILCGEGEVGPLMVETALAICRRLGYVESSSRS
jgi:hypothetical protein